MVSFELLFAGTVTLKTVQFETDKQVFLGPDAFIL